MPVKQFQATSGNSGNNYYSDYTTTTLYVEHSFGFCATKIAFVNDSNNDTVQVSFDGATLHYEIQAAEYKDLPCGGRDSIYVKATTGGGQLRISAT